MVARVVRWVLRRKEGRLARSRIPLFLCSVVITCPPPPPPPPPNISNPFLRPHHTDKQTEHKCHGCFLPRIAVATLNFRTPERSTTITYRVVDGDTMAVSVVEVESQRAVVQYGHMLRLPVQPGEALALPPVGSSSLSSSSGLGAGGGGGGGGLGPGRGSGRGSSGGVGGGGGGRIGGM